MSGLGVVLQESVSREREASRTILCFLREQMDVADEVGGRRRSLKERLGFKGMGCCGATWGFGPTTPISVDENDDDDDHDQEEERHIVNPAPVCSGPDPDPVPPASPSMNLAAALAAERRLRASSDAAGGEALPGTPARVSLMRLLEETEGGGDEAARGRREGGGGSDWVCCVCMGRKKGAAFIPCGHTFCRVCSRELWLNRGSCPLCNRPILEILDIF